MEFVNTHHKTAVTLHREGKFLEAIAAFDSALELSPNQPDILSDRATTYLLLEKFSLAILDFDLAAKLEPKRAYRFSSRAFAKERMGDISGAIEDYETAIALDPDDAIAHNNLGMLFEKRGSKTEADKLFSMADSLSDANPKQIPISEDKSTEEVSDEEENTSFWNIIKSVFSKQGFKEFVSFVGNGFKIKN